jgi:hypothetical protein
MHNAFQLPGVDGAFALDHPRNLPMRTRVASMAYDEMSSDGPLYKVISLLSISSNNFQVDHPFFLVSFIFFVGNSYTTTIAL